LVLAGTQFNLSEAWLFFAFQPCFTYSANLDSNGSSYTMPNAWLTQASLGARVSLDQGRHFWVGGTARYLADFADQKRQWGYWSADFTFQSGH